MRIFLSILAFILTLIVVKFALAFLLLAFGYTQIDGGGKLLVNLVAYSLAFIAARGTLKALPARKTEKAQGEPTQCPEVKPEAAPEYAQRVNSAQPWLTN